MSDEKDPRDAQIKALGDLYATQAVELGRARDEIEKLKRERRERRNAAKRWGVISVDVEMPSHQNDNEASIGIRQRYEFEDFIMVNDREQAVNLTNPEKDGHG
jgi:hypothetical protein